MSDYIFAFDLDSTITQKEILPMISEMIHKEKEMCELTEAAMRGEVSFEHSFLQRVDILRGISILDIKKMVKNIPLNNLIVDFIKRYPERCFIITGNIDIWIEDLIVELGMKEHTYCSKANYIGDKLTRVVNIVDKELVAKQFIQPLVVIGDGANDSGMAKVADISIGYGGVRKIAPALLQVVDYTFYDEKECVDFLYSLI